MRADVSRLFHPLLVWLSFAASATGMQITGYQATANDRFASGFPSAPVRNTNEAFIGKEFDWTSVGWNSGNARAGYGFLSPRHHLTAKHFNNTNSRRIFGNDNTVHSVAHSATVNLDLGAPLENTGPDLAVTRLVRAMPDSAGIPRVPILDLNSSSASNTTSAYINRDVFLYGHWGFQSSTGSTRIGQTQISSVTVSGSSHFFETPRTAVQLEGNDSGSPAFLVWTNPDGGKELALIGNHVAIGELVNFHNFTGTHQVMAAINTVMTVDGYALRVEGEPTNTWVGSQSTSIGDRRAWGLSGIFAQAPSDRFVTFNGATAGNGRQVNVNSNHNLRGLYFRNTGSDELGFQFNGTSTLTVGRGGICNLDESRQVFEAPLALGDHQYWDAGAGGVAVRNVATNGRLLSVRSAGPSVMRGNISGSGGLALEGGQLHLEANSTYNGKTWVHAGALRVDGDIRTSEKLIFTNAATLTGHGMLPAIEGGGAIQPDGILTAASIVPAAQGLSMRFVFSAHAPYYAMASTSPNDLLRLTESNPVSTPLTTASSLSIYLANMPSNAATTYRGGLFFDEETTSPSLVSNATWQIFVADPDGEVTHNGETYTPLNRDWSVSFVPETADFADGTVAGLVMRLEIAPTIGTYDAWAFSVFPEHVAAADRSPDAAPFGDGVPNLLAYALALDPLANKSGGMPTATPGEGHLAFRFRRNLNASDLVVAVESSADLANWSEVTASIIVINPDVDGDGNAELLEISIPAEPDETRRFARLKVDFADG